EAWRLHSPGCMHRIALRALLGDRGRFAVALAAVVVATLLMLLPAGVYFGFGRGAAAPLPWVGGGGWGVLEGTRLVDQGATLPAGSDVRLRSHPCVASVRPVVIAWTKLRRPGGTIEPVEIVGGGPHAWETDAPDRVTLDTGDLDVVSGNPIGAPVELGGRTV